MSDYPHWGFGEGGASHRLRQIIVDHIPHMVSQLWWHPCADMGSPANLTMTARATPKFCAKSWSRDEHIFHLDLISSDISEK